MSKPFLFVRYPALEKEWPFVPEALIEKLDAGGGVTVVNEPSGSSFFERLDLSGVIGIATLGHRIPRSAIERARELKIIGGVFDNAGAGSEMTLQELESRGIAVIDATRAWAQSVAECAFAMALCGLRSIPQWHCRMAAKEPLWVYQAAQFCDNSDFVNGDLGEKKVGVMGLGQIGRRIAQWSVAFGAEVFGYDPFVPDSLFREWGVRKVSLDEMVDTVDIVFVAIPPTPSAKGILNRDRIGRLKKGAQVNIITRAYAVDMAALRERILANELFGAFDVYDREPVPVDDPLRGRTNVVHTPHIAGRTRDANLRVARVIAEDFMRVVRGEQPNDRLTARAVEVRTGAAPKEA